MRTPRCNNRMKVDVSMNSFVQTWTPKHLKPASGRSSMKTVRCRSNHTAKDKASCST